METAKKIALIQAQLDAVDEQYDVDDFEAWKHQNEVAVRLALGTHNPTYEKLVDVRFTSPITIFNPANRADSVMKQERANEAARRSGVQQSASLLKAARGEVELLAEIAQTSGAETTAPGGTRVFIVHGHDEGRKHEVARLVRNLTGVEPTILSEYASKGDTVIEKFERAAAEAAFAIVIASADDLGGTRSTAFEDFRPRARQNVIFELGYFIGTLGRARVALLLEEGVDQPSDTDGIVYIRLDRNGGWKLPLAQELNSAGVAVDFNALA